MFSTFAYCWMQLLIQVNLHLLIISSSFDVNVATQILSALDWNLEFRIALPNLYLFFSRGQNTSVELAVPEVGEAFLLWTFIVLYCESHFDLLVEFQGGWWRMDSKRMPRSRMVVLLMVLALALPSSHGAPTISRPDPSDASTMARWLVSLNDWGVLR